MDLDPSLLAQIKLAIAALAGGLVRLILRPAASFLKSVAIVIACVICGYYFTPPTLMFFGLDDNWSGGVGALIGLAGLSIAEALIHLNYRDMLQTAWKAFVEAWAGVFARSKAPPDKDDKAQD